MHKWGKQIMDCVKAKIDGIGMDNLDESMLCEFEKWTAIASNIAKFDYHYKIIEAMEEAEYGEDYDVNGRKGYNSHRNMSNGRFIRGYEQPIMSNDMRDMDRMNHNKMYYTEMPNHNESHYERTKREYTESKIANPNDKAKHLEMLNKNIDAIDDDMKHIKSMNLSNEERTTLKTRLTNMANTI